MGGADAAFQGPHFENHWNGDFSDHLQPLFWLAISCPEATYNNSLYGVSEYIVCGRYNWGSAASRL